VPETEDTIVLSLSPTLSDRFTAFADEALEGGVLSERERALVVLAAAVALEDAPTVKQAVVAAKQAGVVNDEIGHVSATVVAVRGLRVATLGLIGAPTARTGTRQTTCCG
jgi:alkylhydroperoxidase/carboxymuconolactone decarboxylase family protein YurZ